MTSEPNGSGLADLKNVDH